MNSTLAERLDQYAVGQKIRDLRTGKQLGLVELGRHTGLSAALLSKIERGKMYPTLPTLLRIAMVFGVGLDYFFTQQDPGPAVVRKKDRLRLPARPDVPHVPFYFESLDYPAKERLMSAYLADFQPMSLDDVMLHRHQGAEFIYVVEGKMGLYARQAETVLQAGDAVYFDAGQQHGYRRIGRTRCRAVVVVVSRAG